MAVGSAGPRAEARARGVPRAWAQARAGGTRITIIIISETQSLNTRAPDIFHGVLCGLTEPRYKASCGLGEAETIEGRARAEGISIYDGMVKYISTSSYSSHEFK